MFDLSKKIKLIRNDSFYEVFKKKINNFDLSEKDKVILAISGGIDSISLLYLMRALNKYEIFVVHINHKLRKRSDEDEKFVRNLSNEMNVKFISKSLEVKGISKGASIEEWARKNRYSYLNKTLLDTESKFIMTAHHANDQVETILMNFARGSGILGLRGIAKENKSLIRPLLSFKKIEIIKFSKRIRFDYCIDLTNNDLSIPRNFIRHKVISPWAKDMEFIFKGFEKSVCNLSEWQSALDYLIINSIYPHIKISINRFSIDKNYFLSFPKLIKIRVIQLLIGANKNILWSSHKIEMLNNFLKKNKVGNIIELNRDWRLLKDRKFIFGEKKNKNSSIKILKIKNNHKIYFNNYMLEFFLSKKIKKFNQKQYEIVDWAKIKDKTLKIRNWVEGDKFQPLGMKGNQKVSDMLINLKINQFSKEKIPIITANENIIWVCGIRISEKVKITNNTTEFAYLKWGIM